MIKERKDVLLIEDDRGHAELVHRAFDHYKEEFRLSIVTSMDEARQFLGKHHTDLVIADLVLPDGRGTELLPEENIEIDFPMVVMTGYGDEQVAVDTLKAGALDYVVKEETNLREMPRIADRALREWEHIIERKRAENALTQSEEKFRALIEKTSDLIAIINKNGLFRYLSPAAIEITGYEDRDFIGQPPVDFLHPDDEAGVYYIVEQAMESIGSTIPVPTFRLRHNDGSWVILEGVVTNMLEVPGVNGLVLNCRDVTKLKQMEEGLHRMQKLESIGVLAGGIAHDYNNLLTIILGNLTVAKLADTKEKAINSLEEAEKGVLKARDLTRQLLTFAKGGAPVKETASVADIIRDSASFSLRGSNVSLNLEFQDELFPVDVDRGQFSQVIHNLVLNADQAMPDGGTINIKASNLELLDTNAYNLTPGKYILIQVSDTGFGIPPENKRKVFDPYFTTKKMGSGLGLSIVYSVIKRHNGSVDLKSKPGEGTAFYIYLPASEGQVVTLEPTGIAQEGEGKILVMDDEESIREVASVLLETLGYEVSLASTGEEAVQMCRGGKFDAVVMDLTIPGGMGGCDAARIIREFDKDIILVVSSGYSNDPVMASYKDYGFDDVLMKPYRLDQMGEVLHRLLKNR